MTIRKLLAEWTEPAAHTKINKRLIFLNIEGSCEGTFYIERKTSRHDALGEVVYFWECEKSITTTATDIDVYNALMALSKDKIYDDNKPK